MSLYLKDQAGLKTIRDWLRWTYSRFNEAELFYGHGCVDGWDEAVYLVLQALELPWDIDTEFYDSRVTVTEAKRLGHLVEQRINARKPLPYLLNKAWFCHLPFYVDERVLVPRSPIAELIENHFSPWMEGIEVKNILDLCCGSGCIGIASAENYPHAKVDLMDISQDALEVAAINVDQFQLWGRVEIIQSDLFSSLYEEEKQMKYQLIVSNPPYVSAEEMDMLPEEYRYEPGLGLSAGEDGLDIVHKILHQSVNFLDDKGLLVLEVGNSQWALEEAYPDVPFTWIEFKRGGHGVFALTADECRKHFGR